MLPTVQRSWLCVAILMAASCEAPSGVDALPEPSAYGENLDVFTDAEDLLCAGTLAYMDRYTGALQALHGTTGRVPYYWFARDQDAIGSVCSTTSACTEDGAIVTSRMPHEHELVHGVRWKNNLSHLVLEEGAAEAWGDIFDRNEPSYFPLTEALEVVERDGDLPLRYYPTAGLFTAYLIAEFGRDDTARISSASRIGDGTEQLDHAIQEVLGVSLAEVIDGFEGAREQCGRSLYRDDSISCEVAATVPCNDPTSEDAELELRPGCDSADAIGTMDDTSRVEFVFDVPTPRMVYFLYEGDVEGLELSYRACEAGCDSTWQRITPEAEEEAILFAGRYLLRAEVAEPAQDLQGLLRIRNICG